jgi:hypothetical protein
MHTWVFLKLRHVSLKESLLHPRATLVLDKIKPRTLENPAGLLRGGWLLPAIITLLLLGAHYADSFLPPSLVDVLVKIFR